MRVAIYARYSSENQSEKSIEDQVRVCKNYIQDNGMQCDEKHIFVDEAISGSVLNRPGPAGEKLGWSGTPQCQFFPAVSFFLESRDLTPRIAAPVAS